MLLSWLNRLVYWFIQFHKLVHKPRHNQHNLDVLALITVVIVRSHFFLHCFFLSATQSNITIHTQCCCSCACIMICWLLYACFEYRLNTRAVEVVWRSRHSFFTFFAARENAIRIRCGGGYSMKCLPFRRTFSGIGTGYRPTIHFRIRMSLCSLIYV